MPKSTSKPSKMLENLENFHPASEICILWFPGTSGKAWESQNLNIVYLSLCEDVRVRPLKTLDFVFTISKINDRNGLPAKQR